MKTLQQNDAMGDDCETYLWENKSARDVLRDQYHDRCVLKPLVQPKSTRTGVSRPTTYTVIDRTDCESREDEGRECGTLVELP